MGADGKPRELHIPQACDVANLAPLAGLGDLEDPQAVPGGTRQMVGQGSCFRTERWVLDGAADLPVSADSFMAVILLAGSADLTLGDQTAAGKAGETYFVPAQDAELHVTPGANGCTLLRVTVPAA